MRSAFTPLPAVLGILCLGLPLVAPSTSVAAQPQPTAATYLCSRDLVIDPKTAQGQVHLIEPSGDLATVDVNRGLRARDLILHGTKKERENELRALEENPAAFPPPIFFYAARAFWREGRKEDGTFWFYAGQLRSRFDAARCGDPAGKEAVTLLSDAYGAEIADGLSQDLELARTAIYKVIEWDKRTGHQYDPRWINLHVVTAYLAAPGAQIPDSIGTTVPKDQWPEVAELTRKQLLQEFEQAAAKIQRNEDSPEDDDQD